MFPVFDPEAVVPGDGPVAIYVLVDPRDSTVRYVGRTFSPATRLTGHVSAAATSTRVMRAWVEELKAIDRRPTMTVMERATRDVYHAVEARWIAYYRARGEIYNLRDGDKHPVFQQPSNLARRGLMRTISFTADELTRIERRAAAAGKSRNEYMRARALGQPCPPVSWGWVPGAKAATVDDDPAAKSRRRRA